MVSREQGEGFPETRDKGFQRLGLMVSRDSLGFPETQARVSRDSGYGFQRLGLGVFRDLG